METMAMRLKSWVVASALLCSMALANNVIPEFNAPRDVVFDHEPRVRREWRALNDTMRQRVADAFWTVKNLTTTEGQALYGEKFINYDEILLLHSCAVKDPRCDQGHYGPQFITFHRAVILLFEEAVLAVDPGIGAIPYWDYAADTDTGKYYEDPDKYIFSDKYFGSYSGNENQDGTVTDGLFAYWPVAEWTPEKYGSTSSLVGMCPQEEWFAGTEASVCDRCCGKEECDCGDTDTFRTFLRDHDDCNPYVARDPFSGARFGGTYDIQGTQEHFEACHNRNWIKEWMDWQNCIEFEQPSCILQTGIAASCVNILPKEWQGTNNFLDYLICGPCRLTGFYDDESGDRHDVQALHSQAHVRFGKDLLDVTTSPNDVGPFMGYHANIDRNHMIWMMESREELENESWKYPASQKEGRFKNLFHLSGPYATYGKLVCGLLDPSGDNKVYTEYNKHQRWFSGTLLDDTLNEGYPFTNIFDTTPENGKGYTHSEVIYYSSPQRTPYTYDTLESYYYDSTK